MTSWIKNAAGDHALIDDDQVELWTRLRGWQTADEPSPTTQVWVHHDGLTPARIPYEALAAGWSDMGWTAGPPPEPVDPARQVAVQLIADVASYLPAIKNTQAADGGETREE